MESGYRSELVGSIHMRCSVRMTDTAGDKWVETGMKMLPHHMSLAAQEANTGYHMTSCEEGNDSGFLFSSITQPASGVLSPLGFSKIEDASTLPMS